MATSPRAERRRLHHLQEIDWSKISNYSLQEERMEPKQSQMDLSLRRPYLPTPQETAMASRRQMMPPAPAYETMLNDYKRGPVGLDTTSSTQHRQVIQNALDALRASNDQGYLAMLMQRQKELAQGTVLASNVYASQNGDQGRLNAALKTRPAYLLTDTDMESPPRVTGSMKPDFVSKSPGRVEQLQQHMKLLSSESYIQTNPPVASPNPPPKGKYPPGGVSRASAA